MEMPIPSEFYESKVSDRKQYETRAESLAAITLPYAIRRDGQTGSTPMEDSNSQSFCGRAVNTLKAKMGMALLPPSTSSFRLQPNSEIMMQIALSEGAEQQVADMNKTLSAATNIINKEIESQQIRESLFNVIVQLILVGSCIVEKVEGDGIIIHTLKNIAVDLDSRGKPFTLCFKETLSRLPENITVAEEQDEYELYTMLYLDPESKDSWIMTQDIDGELVGDEKTFKTDKLPYKYLGWTWMSGDYCHRPFAEDYFKDMESIDSLSSLMSDGSIIAGKQIIFVNERGGRTRKDAVAMSANGDVVDGSAEDVTAFRSEKGQDIGIVSQYLSELKRELASSFLLNESATRDAERVTAEEVRFMAQELETSSLAGIYSKLSVEWSEWLINQIIGEVKFDFTTLEPNVITGLDALGRTAETQKLDGAMGRITNLQLNSWIKENELVNRILLQQGIDMTGLVKTPDEKKAEDAAAQQAAQQAAAQQSMADGAANIVQEGQKQAGANARAQSAQEQAPQ